MGGLLSGNAPLRGRAGLELVVPTLDFQLAAQFWELTDPVLAIKVHAIVGGTPSSAARPPTGASSPGMTPRPGRVTSTTGYGGLC
jgi:hypothetical protein